MHCRQLEFTTQEIKFIFLKASIPLCFIIPVWFREIVFFFGPAKSWQLIQGCTVPRLYAAKLR